MRILVVEDMPADVELMVHELRRAGLSPQCLRVQSREDFVAEVDSRPPDLILSDHGVPGFDAIAAFNLAREHCPKVPFVIVTGSTAEFDSHLPVSADGYVRKSELRQLWPVVRQAMRNCSSREPLEEALLCCIEFNLSHLARDIMQDTLHYATGREVEWVIKPLPDVMADPALLGRALRILVENAFQFTRNQSLARIEIGGIHQNGDALIYVRDNSFSGASDSERLLSFFCQQPPEENVSVEPEFQPLDIVRQIARRHGGRTWAESMPEHGTRFVIVLPLQPGANIKTPNSSD